GLRLGLFGGEAGVDNRAFRDRLGQTGGVKVRKANFGVSEVMSIIGGPWEHTRQFQYQARGGGVVAVRVSRCGGSCAMTGVREGVRTHLAKECQPLVRYRARDVLTVTDTGPCACGRAGWRFRVSGRTDDMFNVRGVNVFPTSVQRVVADSDDLASGHFRIAL